MNDAPTLDIAELRRLADSATPGPWPRSHWAIMSRDKKELVAICGMSTNGPGTARASSWYGRETNPTLEHANARFIAAARTAVPALLDAYERVCKERDEARKSLGMHHDLVNTLDGNLATTRAQAERDAETIKRLREALSDVHSNLVILKGCRNTLTVEDLVGPVRTIRAALASALDAGEQQEKRDD